MLTWILKGTPSWVLILFFALVALGCLQSRDRTVGRSRVAITPAAMIALSFYNVLSSFAFVGLVSWAVGAGVAVWLGIQFTSQGNVSYSAETKSFFVPGSWIPLALMMAIFFTKFTVAIMQARRLPAVSEPAFIGASSLCYGVFSGIFFVRTAVIWRSARTSG